jgi:hypothetical protein
LGLSAWAASTIVPIPYSQEPATNALGPGDWFIVNTTNSGTGTQTTKRAAVGGVFNTFSAVSTRGTTFNVKNLGALGSPSDDTAVFGLAITNAANAGGGTVFVPAGSYVVKNLYLLNDVILAGEAVDTTTVTMNSAARGWMISTYPYTNWGIQNIKLVGGATSTDGSGFTTNFVSPTQLYRETWLTNGTGARNGILVSTLGQQFIDNVVVDGFTNGFYGMGPPSGMTTPANLAVSIRNSFAEECYVGWNWSGYDPTNWSSSIGGSGVVYNSTFPEFCKFWNIGASHCAYGMWMSAGNNIVVASQFNMNQCALTMQTGSNTGHGKFLACDFNHNNGQWALWADQINYGEMFYECSFMGGGGGNGIKLAGCTGFRFEGCFIDNFDSQTSISSSLNSWFGVPPSNFGAANQIANSYVYGHVFTNTYGSANTNGLLITNDGTLTFNNVRSFWYPSEVLVSGPVTQANFNTTNNPSAGQILTYDGTNAFWGGTTGLSVTQQVQLTTGAVVTNIYLNGLLTSSYGPPWTPTNLASLALFLNYTSMATNSSQLNWTDQVSSIVFTNVGNTITNSASGVYFPGTVGQYFVNQRSGIVLSNTVNAIWACFSVASVHAAWNAILGTTNNNPSGWYAYNDYYLCSQSSSVIIGGNGPWVLFGPQYELCNQHTGVPGSGSTTFYTNGVAAGTFSDALLAPTAGVPLLGAIGQDFNSNQNLNMYLKFVAICTNYQFTAADIANLHAYALSH